MAHSDSDTERKHKRKKKKRSRSGSEHRDRKSSKSSKYKKSKKAKRSRSRSTSRSRHSTSRSRRSTSRSRRRTRSRSRHRTSRSKSRGRGSRSRSRGRKSRSHSTSRRSHSPRRRSGSTSRGSDSRSKHGSHRNTPDTKDKKKEREFSELPPLEQAKLRMKKALNAVASSDDQLKLKDSDDVTVTEQARFSQAMDSINNDSFTPTAFTSSRSNPKSKADFTFGTSGELVLGPAEQTKVISTESYAHPNLKKDPEESMKKWIIKLTSIRQKILKDFVT